MKQEQFTETLSMIRDVAGFDVGLHVGEGVFVDVLQHFTEMTTDEICHMFHKLPQPVSREHLIRIVFDKMKKDLRDA
jgi:hypothetical protein